MPFGLTGLEIYFTLEKIRTVLLAIKPFYNSKKGFSFNYYNRKKGFIGCKKGLKFYFIDL